MMGFSFILTEKCNWKCEYCYFSNISKQSGPRFETFQKHLPYIKKIIDTSNCHGIQVNIDIQGGEVGLIPLKILQEFFQTIKHKTVVSTNGEFLKRGYHLDEKIRPFIGAILWHVSTNFASKIDVDYNDEEIFISRGIVHNDLDEMVNFIKINPNITFDYVEFEFDLNERRTMTVPMYHDLIKQLKELDNVTENALNILNLRLLENANLRDDCSKVNGSVVIDLVNENICLCQRRPDDCIPLNRANLIERLKGFPQQFFEGRGCESCTRLYSAKMGGTRIGTTMRMRSIL